MKKIQSNYDIINNSWLLILFVVLSLNSCIRQDDFASPEALPDISNDLESNTTILELRSLYTGALVSLGSSTGAEEKVISGYVVSNDSNGNFRNIIYIQDQPKDPVAGIAIAVATENSNSIFPVGKNIAIKLNSFGMDQINGVLQIGTVKDGVLSPISNKVLLEKTTSSVGVSNITPKDVTAKKLEGAQDTPELEDDLVGTLVRLDNMQLIQNERGKNFTDSENEEATERTLLDCNDRTIIGVLTASTTTFSNEVFPEEQGFITGVYTRSGLVLRSSNDVKFANERCDFVEPVANVTIAQVRNVYTNEAAAANEAVALTPENLGLPANSPAILSGYVISSDKSNNIQNTLYIQDALENPSVGIAIDINQRNLYTSYPIGKKIYIKLNGLGVDSQRPELHIGVFNDPPEPESSFITDISAGATPIEEIIVPSQDPKQTIIPKEVTILEIENKTVPESVLIVLEMMQLDCLYAGTSTSYAGGFKTFYSCNSQTTTQLDKIKDDAIFANDIINEAQCSITAIIKESELRGKRFLRISSKEDLNFNELACNQITACSN